MRLINGLIPLGSVNISTAPPGRMDVFACVRVGHEVNAEGSGDRNGKRPARSSIRLSPIST